MSDEIATKKKTLDHILNALRQATVTWHVRSEVLRRASKNVVEGAYKNGKPKTKRYYQCAKCKEWFRDVESLEVDHIEEIGSFSGDFNEYIARMFCDISNLAALCSPCHQRKTTANAKARWTRKR